MIWLLAFGWKPTKNEVPLDLVSSKEEAIGKATEYASKIQGTVHSIAPTGSMRPLLAAEDIVVIQKVSFDSIKVGDVLVYQATWLPPTAAPVIHRAVQKDSYGWIMSGDTARSTESQTRVTEANYLGSLVKIYRAKTQ